MEHLSDLLGPTPYTGETPEVKERAENHKRDYSVAPEKAPDTYNFVMTPTHVSVAPGEHGELFGMMGVNDDKTPHAFGNLTLHYNWDAVWQIDYSNMSLHLVEKRLKKYTKDQGWNFEGMIDEHGSPLMKTGAAPGIGEINPGVKDWRNKEWSGTEMYDNPGHEISETPFYGLQDPVEEMPMADPRTCSECGELMLNYDDWRNHVLREHVNPDRRPPRDPQPVVDLDDVLPADFNNSIMDKTVQRQSRLIWQLASSSSSIEVREESMGSDPFIPFTGVAEPRPSEQLSWMSIQEEQDARLFNAYEGGQLVGSLIFEEKPNCVYIHSVRSANRENPYIFLALARPVREAARRLDVPVDGSFVDSSVRQVFEKMAAKGPTVPGPMPFIYDIEVDRIYVGHPGERHSDIQGRFTPGGIVEGIYDPKGSVQIRTDTDMPYTVRHMIELWYALHPELEVKSIYLLVGEKRYKLSSANIAHKVRNLLATDPAAWAAYKALKPLGNVYAVGGAIRDVILGKTPKDVDLMVQGVDSEDVRDALEALPGRVDYTGQQFGVFRYRDPEGNEVEVALPRTERSTGGGHKDFEVFTSPYISVGEDLARRDFTGNAMAVNLTTGDLIDPFRGSEDIKSGLLRTVSERSFPEDPLRILRALSSVSRHGLDPSPELYHQMAAHAADLSELPQERVMMELDKMMGGADPAKAIAFAEATGVLKHILSEVHATIGFDQKNKYHNLPLNDHLRKVLDRAAQRTDDLDIRWAALLHDIGKPASQWLDDEGWAHYYKGENGEGEDHELVGARMSKAALDRLKFPTDRIDRIHHLVTHHMFPKFDSEKGARKFLNRVGDEHAHDLLTLRDADAGGKGNEWDGSVIRMKQLVQHVQENQQPTKVSQLAINGNDLIEAGIQPGPQMGTILRWLTDMVIEDPTLNDRSKLLELALSTETGQTVDLRPKTANILDPIQDTLDPDVFNNAASLTPAIKPKIIEWVTKKVYSTLVKAGWPDPSKMDYVKLMLTGSLTTYQWSETSDFDVGLWIITENLPEWVRADLIAMMVEACDGIIVPGTTHPLQVFVVDSRKKTFQDMYQPGIRSAYDLDKREWYVLPEKGRVQDVYKNYPATIAYARGCVDKIRMLLRYDKYALETYWDFLHHLRAKSMQRGEGDYSEANIVYKMVVNEGLLPHIGEATGRYYAA